MLTKRAEKTLSQGRVKNFSLKKNLAETAKKINEALNNYLKKQKESNLTVEIKRLLLSGGKRLRPALFYYAYKACGGQNEKLAVDIGAALELFHTFALIHDDIIDNSDLRRGRSTVHKRIGVCGAILAGDLCLTFANDLFYQSITKGKLNFPALERGRENWQKMQEEVILGENEEINLSVDKFRNCGKNQRFDFGVWEGKIWRVMEQKTASYTFIRPLYLAASLTSASWEIFNAFSIYGKNLGLAFQIKDDILGMFAEEKVIGKPADSDLKEGKITLLVLKTIKKLKTEEAKLKGTTKNLNLGKFLSLWGNQKVERKNLEWLRREMRRLGVFGECEEIAFQLVKKAKKAIKESPLRNKDKAFFLDLADYVVRRKY